MQIYLHQSHHQIGDFSQIFDDLLFTAKGSDALGIHLFPESFLTGYPLQDTVLHRTFIVNYHKHLRKLNESLLEMNERPDLILLVGGLEYDLDDSGLPVHIYNVIYQLIPGKELESIYRKCLLPNYDIFDEEKYFTPGNSPAVLNWNNLNLGLMICEDMWFSSSHNYDPSTALFEYCQENKLKLDLLINLSASPWFLGKPVKRAQRAKELSILFQCPLAYVNRVGAEDEILFDGASFILSGDKILSQGKSWEEDLLISQLTKYKGMKGAPIDKIENTWESLFNPSLDLDHHPPIIPSLSDEDCDQLIRAIQLGIQDYAQKTGFHNFLIALSGGMDSALVLAILKLIKTEGQTLEAIYMPGFFSASLSYELSAELCQKLEVPLKSFPIKFLHSSIRNAYQDVFKSPMEGLSDENIQSRLRGALLYARSNEKNLLVINTSNKSELAVGYSTLYGDSVGAISMLGDLYKSEVFQLAEYINRKYDNIIPEGIITRPPSAELRENQEDSHSLPPYERLDAILEGFLSFRKNAEDLIKLGFSKEEVTKVFNLYIRSEFKRGQFCPIIKLKAKSFGFGYRIPITKSLKMENS